MPELPEVEVIARGLRARLVGHVLENVRLLRRDVLWRRIPDFENKLEGRRAAAVVRRGKYLLLRLSGGLTLLVHLGMTGRLWLADEAEPPAPHTHFRAGLAGLPLELRLRDPRRFGGMDLFSTAREAGHPRLVRVAPDPFQMPAPEFAERIRARHAPIKAVLLNQSVVGGLGNIYADESLWAARIHPLARADMLKRPRLVALHGALLAVLERAIAFGGSSISDFVDHLGAPGYFQNEHRVYGRAGRPCPRCGRTLARAIVAQRGTTFCPRCQRLATARDSHQLSE